MDSEKLYVPVNSQLPWRQVVSHKDNDSNFFFSENAILYKGTQSFRQPDQHAKIWERLLGITPSPCRIPAERSSRELPLSRRVQSRLIHSEGGNLPHQLIVMSTEEFVHCGYVRQNHVQRQKVIITVWNPQLKPANYGMYRSIYLQGNRRRKEHFQGPLTSNPG